MGSNRTLIYVPVLHSPADMGSFADNLAPSRDYAEQVGAYWDQVDAEFRAMARAWAGIRVYQDGLPNARADIVARIIADVDSPNYRLVRWLVSQGAIAVGTEDPVLLQEEYELLKASLTDDAARQVYAARASGLLTERDRYIAARVGATLPVGGTGVLFIGMQHDVARALPADVTVTSPRCCRGLARRAVRLAARRTAETRRAAEGGAGPSSAEPGEH
jgi:hypothetical protein